MARYFFSTENGEFFPDEEGVELPDFEAAKREALQILIQSLDRRPELFWKTGDWRVIVSDARRLTLFNLELTAIMSAAAPRGRSS